MGQYRIQRLDDQLRDEISQLIMRGDVKDPRVNTFLSINILFGSKSYKKDIILTNKITIILNSHRTFAADKEIIE